MVLVLYRIPAAHHTPAALATQWHCACSAAHARTAPHSHLIVPLITRLLYRCTAPQFIAGCANMRARNYAIPEVDKLQVGAGEMGAMGGLWVDKLPVDGGETGDAWR